MDLAKRMGRHFRRLGASKRSQGLGKLLRYALKLLSSAVAIRPARGRRCFLERTAHVVVLVGLYLAAKTSGVIDNLNVTTMQQMVHDAGAWGVLLYVALFAGGTLVQVPGTLFVATGILVYGGVTGYLVCLLGAIVSVCTTFMFVRVVGGDALSDVERPFVRRMLRRLDKRPVTTMVVLRMFLFISPPLNYALALSPMRFRDYAIGSAIGLTLPMAVTTIFWKWIFAQEWFARLFS